jgi:hypothetical protein
LRTARAIQKTTGSEAASNTIVIRPVISYGAAAKIVPLSAMSADGVK